MATTSTSDTTTTDTEAGVVARIAQQAVQAQPLTPNRIYLVSDEAGATRVLDTLGYAGLFAGRPRRKSGTTEVYDASAFSWLLAKHGLDETELYADVRTQTLCAVLNAHGGTPPNLKDGVYDRVPSTASVVDAEDDVIDVDSDDADAGWGDHRLLLRLYKTPAWAAWEKLDRQLVSQAQFAEHVEERLVDFRQPSGADMLELAQTFQGTRSAAFESSERLADGQVQLAYREETKAQAGKAGRLTIPETFELALVPFEGGQAYKVEARLRYRLEGGSLRLGYLLTRPEDILRAAFLDQTADVANATGRRVLNGKAPAARNGAELRA